MPYYFHSFSCPPGYGGRDGHSDGWVISQRSDNFSEWTRGRSTLDDPHGDKYRIRIKSDDVIVGEDVKEEKVFDRVVDTWNDSDPEPGLPTLKNYPIFAALSEKYTPRRSGDHSCFELTGRELAEFEAARKDYAEARAKRAAEAGASAAAAPVGGVSRLVGGTSGRRSPGTGGSGEGGGGAAPADSAPRGPGACGLR